jgi:chemotaxis protein MotB
MVEKDIRRRIAERAGAAGAGNEPDTTNIWQTVYGDMMTNLMLFFLMMFCLNLVGQDHFQKVAKVFKDAVEGKPVEGLQSVLEDIPKAQTMNEFFQKFADRENMQIIEQGEGIRLRLPEPVLFDSGEAELKSAAKLLLTEFGAGLKNLPNTLVVEGHTDNVPIRGGRYRSNWELSEARAESVVNYLIAQGVPPHRLAVAGFGEFWPFVPNDSDINRALNRRIELLVLHEEEE